jgi:hypothetical protein
MPHSTVAGLRAAYMLPARHSAVGGALSARDGSPSRRQSKITLHYLGYGTTYQCLRKRCFAAKFRGKNELCLMDCPESMATGIMRYSRDRSVSDVRRCRPQSCVRSEGNVLVVPERPGAG